MVEILTRQLEVDMAKRVGRVVVGMMGVQMSMMMGMLGMMEIVTIKLAEMRPRMGE